jgi:hypothetical protein
VCSWTSLGSFDNKLHGTSESALTRKLPRLQNLALLGALLTVWAVAEHQSAHVAYATKGMYHPAVNVHAVEDLFRQQIVKQY